MIPKIKEKEQVTGQKVAGVPSNLQTNNSETVDSNEQHTYLEELAISYILNSESAGEMVANTGDLKPELIQSVSLRQLYSVIVEKILLLKDLASFNTVFDKFDSAEEKSELLRIKRLKENEYSYLDLVVIVAHLNTFLSEAKSKEASEIQEKCHVDVDLINACIDTPLAQFASELAKSAKMPRNTTFLTVLSIFSSVSCRYRSAAYQYGAVQPIGLNFCGEQPPSASKSRVLQASQKPIFEQIRARNKGIYSEIAKLEMQLETNELDKDEIKEVKVKISNKKTDLRRSFEFITDTTPEALDSSLQDSSGYFSIASAEQGAINTLFGITYGDGKGGISNKDLILKGFNGEWHRSMRKGRETYSGNVVGCVTALAQSGMIKNLLNASGGSGAVERFILWSEKSLLGTRDHTKYHKINEPIQNRFDNTLVEIYKSIDNTPYLDILSLTISDRMWHQVALRRNELEPTIAESGINSAKLLQGAIGKYDLFVMKIAANLHLSVDLNSTLIRDERVKEAMVIADAYLLHVKSLINEQVVEALSDRETVILEWIGIKRKKGVDIAKGLFRKKCFIKGGKQSTKPVYEELQKMLQKGLIQMDVKDKSVKITDAIFYIE